MPDRIPAGKVIALTGATGFIGRFLLNDLMQRGYKVRVLLRKPVDVPVNADSAVIGDITCPQNMSEALKDVSAVIHSAGLAHAMTGLPEDDYRTINTEATANLASAAHRAGVERFIFLSSIRAQSGPTASQLLTETMKPEPTDAYGRSKLAAEEALATIGIDWVALRPVLVYGDGIKGNMAALLQLAQSPWPLPLAALKAKRSLLAIENLTEAVDLTLKTAMPLRRPLIVADDNPLTIGEMIQALRFGLGRKAGLIPIPESVLRFGCSLLGKSEAFERVAGSLTVSTEALKGLGWRPPVTSAQGLTELARRSSYGV